MYHLGPQFGGPRCPPHKVTEIWKAELSCMAEAKEFEMGPEGEGEGPGAGGEGGRKPKETTEQPPSGE